MKVATLILIVLVTSAVTGNWLTDRLSSAKDCLVNGLRKLKGKLTGASQITQQTTTSHPAAQTSTVGSKTLKKSASAESTITSVGSQSMVRSASSASKHPSTSNHITTPAQENPFLDWPTPRSNTNPFSRNPSVRSDLSDHIENSAETITAPARENRPTLRLDTNLPLRSPSLRSVSSGHIDYSAAAITTPAKENKPSQRSNTNPFLRKPSTRPVSPNLIDYSAETITTPAPEEWHTVIVRYAEDVIYEYPSSVEYNDIRFEGVRHYINKIQPESLSQVLPMTIRPLAAKLHELFQQDNEEGFYSRGYLAAHALHAAAWYTYQLLIDRAKDPPTKALLAEFRNGEHSLRLLVDIAGPIPDQVLKHINRMESNPLLSRDEKLEEFRHYEVTFLLNRYIVENKLMTSATAGNRFTNGLNSARAFVAKKRQNLKGSKTGASQITQQTTTSHPAAQTTSIGSTTLKKSASVESAVAPVRSQSMARSSSSASKHESTSNHITTPVQENPFLDRPMPRSSTNPFLRNPPVRSVSPDHIDYSAETITTPAPTEWHAAIVSYAVDVFYKYPKSDEYNDIRFEGVRHYINKIQPESLSELLPKTIKPLPAKLHELFLQNNIDASFSRGYLAAHALHAAAWYTYQLLIDRATDPSTKAVLIEFRNGEHSLRLLADIAGPIPDQVLKHINRIESNPLLSRDEKLKEIRNYEVTLLVNRYIIKNKLLGTMNNISKTNSARFW